MIDHKTFESEYDSFWSLSLEERNNMDDGAMIALIFIMLALGTQFAAIIPFPHEKEQQAEFWGETLKILNIQYLAQ